MIYAIVETKGKQFCVEPGRFYDIPDCFDLPQQTKIQFQKILLITQKSNIFLGKPWVKNAVVEGRILHTYKSTKLFVYKMQRKKRMRRKKGHRQIMTRFFVESISLNGDILV